MSYVEKRHYHSIPIAALDPNNPNEVWSSKIDGAHALVQVDKGKTPRLFSHRISKRTGNPIEYTQKLPHIGLKSPVSAVFRAETYAVGPNGKAVHPDTVTALLNSNTDNSLAMQKAKGLQTRTAVIDVDEYEGKDLRNSPWGEKQKYINLLAKKIPGFHLPDTADTPEGKKKLLDAILKKQHPQTKEGVVVHHKFNVERPFTKAKVIDDHDVVVTGVFKETEVKPGRVPMAGGFTYAEERLLGE